MLTLPVLVLPAFFSLPPPWHTYPEKCASSRLPFGGRGSERLHWGEGAAALRGFLLCVDLYVPPEQALGGSRGHQLPPGFNYVPSVYQVSSCWPG